MNIKCQYCGKNFNKLIAEINRTKSHYCSKKCTGLGKQKQSMSEFNKKYVIKESGCWEWNKNKNNHGYGVVRYKAKLHLAHRVSYEINTGEIPDGLFVCHKCDNPSCVNPEHLFLGTHLENMQDMFKKGRKKTKLTIEDVLFIRESTLSNIELSIKFSVGERTIRHAKQKTNWMYLPEPPKD